MDWDYDTNFPARSTLATYNDDSTTINGFDHDAVLTGVTPKLVTGHIDDQSMQGFSLSPATSSSRQTSSHQCRLSDDLGASVLRSGSTCLMSAIQLLEALHIPATTCSSSHNDIPLRAPLTIETILSTNALVGTRLNEICSCSCSTTAPVQLLLALTCRKLISWNRIVAHTPTSEADTLDSRSSLAGASTGCQVLHQPIMIGQHRIEGRLGQTLYAHIFHKEMPILESLVESLSERLLEARYEDSAVSSTAFHASACEPAHGSRLSESVRRDLAVFLREHLEAIKMENTRFL